MRLAGIVGGVGLTLVAIVHNALGLDPATVEPGASLEAASSIAHGVAYPLMLVALLAVMARHGSWFGRVGRAAAWALGASLAVLGAFFLVAGLALLAGTAVDFEAWYLVPAALLLRRAARGRRPRSSSRRCRPPSSWRSSTRPVSSA